MARQFWSVQLLLLECWHLILKVWCSNPVGKISNVLWDYATHDIKLKYLEFYFRISHNCDCIPHLYISQASVFTCKLVWRQHCWRARVQDNKYSRTYHPTYGVQITWRVITLVDYFEPIVSCCVPCLTNRDGVHTPESVVHTVLLGLCQVRCFVLLYF